MTREELQTLIDRVIGKKGILRAPSYWVSRLFGNLMDYTDDKAKEGKAYTDDKAKEGKAYTDGAVKNVKITVDSEMSDESENAVSNKVIKGYVDNAVQQSSKVEVIEMTNNAHVTIEPNKKYVWSEPLGKLTIQLTDISGVNTTYMLEFVTKQMGSTSGSSYEDTPFDIELPPEVSWAGGVKPAFEIDARYWVEIRYNIAAARTNVMTIEQVQELDFETDYLTLIAMRDGFTVSYSEYRFDTSIEYSIDNGEWLKLLSESTTPAIGAGHFIAFRGNLSEGCHPNLIPEKTCYLTGRCYSIFRPDSHATASYNGLFAKARIRGVNPDILMDKDGNIPDRNCMQMFYRNVELLYPPKHSPGDTATNYRQMYHQCYSLRVAPVLPATNLAAYAYSGMFAYCSSLRIPPRLPAMNLSEGCYGRDAAGQVAFEEARTYGMFEYSGLTIPADISHAMPAKNCFRDMYAYCKNLTRGSYLPAKTLAEGCYQGLYRQCPNVEYIKMLATDMSATNCLTDWVNGVSAKGTFVKAAGVEIPTGVNGIPSGWTVEEVTE